MTVLLAIDPGTTQSGFVVFDGQRVIESGVHQNEEVLRLIAASQERRITSLAIEMIASYGMAVGREVFETCVWVGRFQQAWHSPASVRLVYRKDVKSYLCHSMKAKDANIRQALIDKIGGNCVFGHTHRAQSNVVRRISTGIIGSWNPGC